MSILGNKLCIVFSKSTLRRYLKLMGYSYKRLRFIPAKEPNKELYEIKKHLIQKYDLLSQRGIIDLYFFDESGFSINSNIPYAWSPINKTMVIKSFHAKRFNILGFINKQGDLHSYLREKSVKSDTVVKVFDEFSKQLKKPTVVVLDNASFHTSKIFKENIAKWSNRGLTLLYLPPYSPELNIIEILWRFIKYHWIEMSAYQSYTNMKEYVQRILKEYGTKRVIDFSLFEKKFYPLVVRN
ncbi:DDE superfamily endonuclease [Epsilonproteobacteria bacterium SCGC AD-308-O04]|jgi:transposase|nr:DDE superfamily endonuclease [Epsilonproteobacteria bacterium SCGC AD-308-O04]